MRPPVVHTMADDEFSLLYSYSAKRFQEGEFDGKGKGEPPC